MDDGQVDGRAAAIDPRDAKGVVQVRRQPGTRLIPALCQHGLYLVAFVAS